MGKENQEDDMEAVDVILDPGQWEDTDEDITEDDICSAIRSNADQNSSLSVMLPDSELLTSTSDNILQVPGSHNCSMDMDSTSPSIMHVQARNGLNGGGTLLSIIMLDHSELFISPTINIQLSESYKNADLTVWKLPWKFPKIKVSTCTAVTFHSIHLILFPEQRNVTPEPDATKFHLSPVTPLSTDPTLQGLFIMRAMPLPSSDDISTANQAL